MQAVIEIFCLILFFTYFVYPWLLADNPDLCKCLCLIGPSILSQKYKHECTIFEFPLQFPYTNEMRCTL